MLYHEPTILTTFTTYIISTMQLLRTWSSFHHSLKLQQLLLLNFKLSPGLKNTFMDIIVVESILGGGGGSYTLQVLDYGPQEILLVPTISHAARPRMVHEAIVSSYKSHYSEREMRLSEIK